MTISAGGRKSDIFLNSSVKHKLNQTSFTILTQWHNMKPKFYVHDLFMQMKNLYWIWRLDQDELSKLRFLFEEYSRNSSLKIHIHTERLYHCPCNVHVRHLWSFWRPLWRQNGLHAHFVHQRCGDSDRVARGEHTLILHSPIFSPVVGVICCFFFEILKEVSFMEFKRTICNR